MSEIEIWKDIEGYEGLYQVSNMGMVKSLKFGKEKILKPSKNKYISLVLCKDGKGKCVLVHRLVASAFIPNDNPTEKTEIKHIDENPSNNHFLNLEWCSHIENLNYGTRNKKISEIHKGKKLSEETKQKMSEAHKKPILQYTKDGEFIRYWDSATQVEKELNIGHSHISACCKGKRKSSGGFIWKYKNVT